MKRLHIFKPGTHIAMDGTEITFSEADLQATATAYDPALHEAPMVIGHPKHDAPAYGWAKGLAVEDGQLYADPDQVDTAFAEMHAAGRFKKRSASFYGPEDPRNPVPGVYYLRHIGFLGAQPPAIKGLKAANFADGACLTIEFGDFTDRTIARQFRNLKNWMIEKFGKEDADKVLDEWDLEMITEEALRPEPVAETLNPAYAEGTETMLTPEQIKQQAELDAREKKLKEQETQFSEGANKETRKANVAFVDSLVKEGKLLPAHVAKTVALLDFASGLNSGAVTIEFGEGDAKKTESPAETLKSLLTAAPKQIEFGELGHQDPPAAQGAAIPTNLAKHV